MLSLLFVWIFEGFGLDFWASFLHLSVLEVKSLGMNFGPKISKLTTILKLIADLMQFCYLPRHAYF